MASIIRSPRFGASARRLSARGKHGEPGASAPPGDDAAAAQADVSLDPAAQLERDHDSLRRENSELGARVASLEAELEALRQQREPQDYALGYELGQEAGAEQARAELKAERDSIAAVLESVHAQGQRYLQQLEDSNVEIIFAAVSKMVARVAGDADYLRDLVREQLKQLAAPGAVVVRVAPADFQALAEQEDADAKNLSDNLRFVPDDHIQLGGCIIEAERGGLDARLEIQLQQFKEMLLDVHARRQAGES